MVVAALTFCPPARVVGFSWYLGFLVIGCLDVLHYHMPKKIIIEYDIEEKYIKFTHTQKYLDLLVVLS